MIKVGAWNLPKMDSRADARILPISHRSDASLRLRESNFGTEPYPTTYCTAVGSSFT